MANSAENNKNLLSRDGEYGRGMELTCISLLISNHFFRMYYVNSTNTVYYGIGSIICYLLLSGNNDAGHFDLL